MKVNKKRQWAILLQRFIHPNTDLPTPIAAGDVNLIAIQGVAILPCNSTIQQAIRQFAQPTIFDHRFEATQAVVIRLQVLMNHIPSNSHFLLPDLLCTNGCNFPWPIPSCAVITATIRACLGRL